MAEANVSGGIGFGGALTLLLIGLKLADVIEWSWLWVLSPIWLPFVALVTIFVVGSVLLELTRGAR